MTQTMTLEEFLIHLSAVDVGTRTNDLVSWIISNKTVKGNPLHMVRDLGARVFDTIKYEHAYSRIVDLLGAKQTSAFLLNAYRYNADGLAEVEGVLNKHLPHPSMYGQEEIMLMKANFHNYTALLSKRMSELLGVDHHHYIPWVKRWCRQSYEAANIYQEHKLTVVRAAFAFSAAADALFELQKNGVGNSVLIHQYCNAALRLFGDETIPEVAGGVAHVKGIQSKLTSGH